MRLHPNRPPGRIDRKAAAYASDIAELRSAGYTYEAIREALKAVGVIASTSALRREMRRLGSPSRPALPAMPCPTSLARKSVAPTPPEPPSILSASDRPELTGDRAAAEVPLSDNPSNPLLRSPEPS